MQFIKDGDFYKVARITGPKHNFLAIQLSNKSTSTEVVELPMKKGDIRKFEKQEVLNQVSNGLNKVNQELKTEFFISEIQFIPSDTPSTTVYEFLVQELIKRIHAKGSFTII